MDGRTVGIGGRPTYWVSKAWTSKADQVGIVAEADTADVADAVLHAVDDEPGAGARRPSRTRPA